MAHARKSEGAAAHADKPAGDGNVDDHRPHERVARAYEEPAKKRKLREILRLTEEQKARSGNQATGGHQPSSPCRSSRVPTSGAAAAPMRIAPERIKEKTPREIPRSLESGFRKTLNVLEIEKAEAMWARKPTATIVQP